MDALQKGEKGSSKLQRILNSLAAFCTAYMACMYLYYFVTACVGKVFGFDAWIYYYGVKFLLGKQHWSKFNILFTYGSGTFTMFLLCGFCAYLFYKMKDRLLVINLVWLWGFVIASSMFCAQFFIACLGAEEYNSPFYQNLTVVFAWIYMPVTITYILAIPAAAMLVFFSIYFSKPFLSLSYSFSKVNKPKRKRKYFFETVFVPYILGSLLMIAFAFPLNVYINVMYVFVIGIALVIAFFIINIQDMKVDEVLRYKTLQKINVPLIIIAFVIFLYIWVTYSGVFLGV